MGIKLILKRAIILAFPLFSMLFDSIPASFLSPYFPFMGKDKSQWRKKGLPYFLLFPFMGRFFQLIKELAEKDGITEKLKAENQMLWVQRMNTVRETATEIVNNDLIFN